MVSNSPVQRYSTVYKSFRASPEKTGRDLRLSARPPEFPAIGCGAPAKQECRAKQYSTLCSNVRSQGHHHPPIAKQHNHAGRPPSSRRNAAHQRNADFAALARSVIKEESSRFLNVSRSTVVDVSCRRRAESRRAARPDPQSYRSGPTTSVVKATTWMARARRGCCAHLTGQAPTPIEPLWSMSMKRRTKNQEAR